MMTTTATGSVFAFAVFAQHHFRNFFVFFLFFFLFFRDNVILVIVVVIVVIIVGLSPFIFVFFRPPEHTSDYCDTTVCRWTD